VRWRISVHAGLLGLISICVPLVAPGSAASDGYALKETILALKPVTFRYKHELDPDGIPQIGTCR
jgi:hypothetical protein